MQIQKLCHDTEWRMVRESKYLLNLLSHGLKFVPTPITNETALRKQLLTDFKDFEKRMRLQFIYHGKDKNTHPFYVKSNWEPPVQQSARELSRRN